MRITVTPVNDAPVGVADSYGVTAGNPLSVAARGVLANDTDVDGDPLTAALVAAPANAQSFALNANGSFTYVANCAFAGTDTFTYAANDGTAGGQHRHRLDQPSRRAPTRRRWRRTTPPASGTTPRRRPP